ncbi:MAG: hypothetical protein AAFX65_04880 [Cyanobacteria bacterium J06638_7]
MASGRPWPGTGPVRLPALLACAAMLTLAGSDPGAVAANRQGQGAGIAVCVVAPRIGPLDAFDAFGIVLSPEPMLVVVEPLLDLQIQRQARPPWQRRGSLARPILTPLAWPAAPIDPEEPVLLQLRPLGAAPDAFAHVQLVGASAQRMDQTMRLMESLGANPDAWLGAFEQALENEDVPLAWTLLFDQRSPGSAQLDELRRAVFERGCGD